MGELEKSPKFLANKLWNIVRIVLYMMRKGIAKGNNTTFDLQMLLRKGKLATKAILGNIVTLRRRHHRYYNALTCKSDDMSATFVSPREYEFSCSNTPVYAFKRKNVYHKEEELKLMNKVLDILNRFDVVEASPFEFTPSPMARHQVDNDAEEFINRFYKDLKNQRRIVASESLSPSPYHICSR
ncbi:uncharacterized protein LOC127239573 [Andrographis paniculata]|uniref:uncharacterized protein LOC127239573 n=1 Tax=Andrographis paniculata TaxID=175694 RepID=UPI0021E873B4|nr:uncharacterized protein LOC127239573 [Andrographis paniculata]